MKMPAPFLSFAIFAIAHFLALTAWGNPVGEQVVAGNATFNRALPGNLTVNQSTHRLIINWQDFSIGRGEITKFVQPSASAAVLNRVVSASPSEIYGTLQGNGNVYVINPAGILVGKEGRIDTRGFVASTLDVANESFMANASLKFSGDSRARVENQGTIESLDGDIYLIGRTVENSGNIHAPNGTVGLAAGSEVLLQPAADDKISVLAGNASGGKADVGVNNLGNIQAAAAELKAAGGNIYALAINNGGLVRAKPVVGSDGRITLKASGGAIQNSGTLSAQNADGSGGSITVDAGHNADSPATVVSSGTISAVGEGSGTVGGQVQVLGDRVGLVGNAVVDVSGDAGGGKVQIGGGYQGNNPGVRNAERTYVGPLTRIRADALTLGNGGSVVIWSDSLTAYYGSISARGGALGGDGGFAEISGKKNLAFNGAADVSAPNGISGSVLLDPQDLRVVTTGANDGLLADSQVLFGEPDAVTDVTISSSAIEALTGNITLQASRDLFVNNALNLANQTFGETVTFEAGRDLQVNAPIQTGGGSLSFSAARDLTIASTVATGESEALGVARSGNINLTSTGGNIILSSTVTTGDASIEDANSSNEQAISGTIAVSAGQSVTGSGRLITGSATLRNDTGGDNGTDSAASGNVSVTAGTAGVTGGIGLSAASAVVVGDASAQNAGDTATSGGITLSSRNAINGGAPGNALSLRRGIASNADTVNQGVLAAATTAADGDILIRSENLLRLGALSTGAGQQSVGITALGDIRITTATESLVGDAVSIDAAASQIFLEDTSFDIGNGSLLLTANDIDADGAAQIFGVGGSLTLRPSTADRAITIGGAGGLSINANVIDAMQDGFTSITIGRGDTGNEAGAVTVAADVTFRDNLNIIGASLEGNQTITAQNPDLTLNNISLTALSGDIKEVNIVANALTATADAGIELDTTINILTSATITGLGDIDIVDSAGGLTISGASAPGGFVDITAIGGALSLNGNVTGDTVTLTGVGISQTAASTVDGGTGDITLDANDGTINLAGSLTTTSPSATAVVLKDASTVTLGNITANFGAVVLGQAAGDNVGGISQNVGTSLSANSLTINSGAAIDLQNVSIGSLGPVTRGGAFTLRDTAGGLTIAGPLTAGTVNNLVDISTAGGVLNVNGDITGSGVSLAGVGVSQAGASTVNAGAGDITVDGNDGAINLAGTLTTSSASATAVVIRDATTVALGNINAGAGTVVLGQGGLDNVGAISQNASTLVTADRLTANSGGTINLPNVSVAFLDAVVRGGGLTLVDTVGGLTIAGPITAGTVNNVVDISSSGALNVNGNITGNGINLTGAGVSQAAASTVNAVSGDITVDGNDGAINLAGTLTTSSSSGTAVVIRDATTVALGNITANSGTVVLGQSGGNNVGAISQNAATTVSADTLTVNSSSSVTLSDVSIATLGTVVRGGAFVLNDTFGGLTVAGPMTGGTVNNDVSLTTIGALALNDDIEANILSLNANGISQGAGSVLDAATLTINSGGAAILQGNNLIDTLGAVTRGGAFRLRDTAGGLVVDGPLTAGTTANAVEIETAGGALTINGSIVANNVDLTGVGVTLNAPATVNAGAGNILVDASGGQLNLDTGNLITSGEITLQDATGGFQVRNVVASALHLGTPGQLLNGAISQQAGTIINVNNLSIAQAGGAINLDQANLISVLDAVQRGGSFTLNDTVGGLTIAGPITAGATANSVRITTAGGALQVNNDITANVVELTGNGVTQSAGSQVNGLNGTILVDGNSGAIDLEGQLTTTSGAANAVTVRDATTLELGNISAASGTVVLGELGQNITSDITQNAGTSVAANNLTIQSGGAITLGNANSITTLGNVVRGGAFLLSDLGGLTIAGALNGGNTANSVDIATSGGNLAVNNHIVGTAVSLAGQGVTQNGASTVNAGAGPIVVDANDGTINLQGTLTSSGVGAVVTLRDAGATALGNISATAGTVILGQAGGDNVGAITQNGGTAINADRVTVNSSGAVLLGQNNNINVLGAVTRNGVFALNDVAGGLTVNGPISGGDVVDLNVSGGILNVQGNVNGTLIDFDGAGLVIGPAAVVNGQNVVLDGNAGSTTVNGGVNGTTVAIAGQGITQNAGSTITGAQDVSLDAGAGFLTVGGGVSSGTEVSLVADDANIFGSVAAPLVIITPDTGNRTISVGGDVAGTLGLSQVDVGNISVNGGILRIGSATHGGNINIVGVISFGSMALTPEGLPADQSVFSLKTQADIRQLSDSFVLTTPNLSVQARSVELDVACNNVHLLAALTDLSSPIRFRDFDSLTVAVVPLDGVDRINPASTFVSGNCGLISINTVPEQLAAIAFVDIPIPRPSSGNFGLGEIKPGAWTDLFGQGAIGMSYLEVPFPNPPLSLGFFEIEEQSKWTPGQLAILGSTTGPQSPRP